MKIVFLFLLFFFLPAPALFAQKLAISDADEYYDNFLYKEAIAKYEEAVAQNNPKYQKYLYEQLAKCHQYSFQYRKAEIYFQKLVDMSEKPNPEMILQLGIMMKFNGKYKDAKEQLKRYQKLTEGEDPYGSFHLRSINWALANDTVLRDIPVSITNLDISGQGLGYCLYDEGLIYTHGRNKEPFYSMTMFDLDYVKRVDSITFESDAQFLSALDFEGNETAPSICGDGSVLYFSANPAKIKDGKVQKNASVKVGKENISNLRIYSALYADGNFGNITELPFNNKSFNCTHPAISADNERLYFASDMPGGLGGFDLYLCKKDEQGKWGEPVNLGKAVNSEENELYPSLCNDRLFFSSKGMNGYGGYDIYTARLGKNGAAFSPQNMGKPVNSFRDDIAFMTYGQGQYGYLSSNRENEDGADHVYYFHDLSIDPKTEFAEKKTALVSDMTKAPVKKPDELHIPVSRDHVKLLPSPKDTLAKNARVLPPLTREKENKNMDNELLNIVFNHVQFGFNDAGLSPDVLATLDSVASVIRMGSKIRVEIAAHTDSRGEALYNKKLSEARAFTARQYLLGKGVPASRIIARGYGESVLLNPCADGVPCTNEEHRMNRRVELKLIR